MNAIQQIKTILKIGTDDNIDHSITGANSDQIKAIQGILNVKQDGILGIITYAKLDALTNTKKPVWPFKYIADGEDAVIDRPITITCFGGNGDNTITDPQDDGQTASGVNTKYQAVIGVSIAMNGLDFPHISPAEHKALDYAPIHKMPWHTQVIVTIKGVKYTASSGIIDLGPGLQASKGNSIHALDLTTPFAQLIYPNKTRRQLALDFEEIGTFRIVGGAKYL